MEAFQIPYVFYALTFQVEAVVEVNEKLVDKEANVEVNQEVDSLGFGTNERLEAF